MNLHRIAVFCGSSSGWNQVYTRAAQDLGTWLASNSIDLVYGGASVGLMGVMADACLQGGGKVTGVIPDFFSRKEITHNGLMELILVGSMHERKMRINQLADAFIALPGGFGTLDELFEILTWGQLDLHQKPLGLLNIHNYFGHLTAFLSQMRDEGFLKPIHHDMVLVSEDIETLIGMMRDYKPPQHGKWISSIKV